jgi:hypothetical protein
LCKIITMDFREAVQPYAEEPLTLQILLALLKEYKRPYDKVNELVKKGMLLPVKKGFYIPGPRLGIARPESFLIANHLWGPSYVSLETALSYWGLIPERAFEVSSVTLKKTKNYKTPVGRFSYFQTPLPYYSFGVKSLQLTARQSVLIASPEKALCDKVVQTSGVFLRSIRSTMDFLREDLRIDEEALSQLNREEIESWIAEAPNKTSLQMLIRTLTTI